MNEETAGRHRKRTRLWLALVVFAVLLAILIVPPYISVSRYKSSITSLISTSLGRPVTLSSVEVRLLPRPGFALTNLSVEEDPAYGSEPVLHANTVIASIRLLSLWRGRLEIDSIRVDEASLNLVRRPSGGWNLDSLFRNAAAKAQAASGGASGRPFKLPYLAATNSRINIKNGFEKLPFSLVNADLSFWQQNPGDWRIRLRGQPARTDLSLDLADTGVVRLEASLRRAPELRLMPVHLDLEWREAQLGQLTRLVLGSDSGWRGDLTGELHLDGTAESAQIKTRLRATGVHRAEFAPADPMDFDANCGLVFHVSPWAIQNLVCDSLLGNGHVRLTGDRPGGGRQPRLSVELDHLPLAVCLDALRTVRNGIGSDLEATGSASGKITYAPPAPEAITPQQPVHPGKASVPKAHPAISEPITGSITVDGLQLRGNGLSQPIRIPKVVLQPALAQPAQQPALTATVPIPLGGADPLTVSFRLAPSGYQVTARGQASIARAREIAHATGRADASALDALAGDPVSLDLSAEGPWMPAQRRPFGEIPRAAATGALLPLTSAKADEDTLTGTVSLHDANWKSDYLASHVEISQATLHLKSGELRWDPVVFSYGPVKGTATLTVPVVCEAPRTCLPHFEFQFGALDAAVLQTAFLGAREPGTLLSTLIDRFRPSAAPVWPQLEGTVKADSLVLGPVTLHDPAATVRTSSNGAEIAAFYADLLGGRIQGSGTFHAAGTAQGRPSYALEGEVNKVSPQAIGQLLGMRWSGGSFDGGGKVELSGFKGDELAGSAKGALHFAWQRGTAIAPAAVGSMPPSLARFDRWTADAEIGNGAVILKENRVKRGRAVSSVQASVILTDPPKVVFSTSNKTPAKR